MVDLASVATLAGDTGLALALPSLDVALAIGGAQSMAVTPGEGTDGHQVGTQRYGTGEAPLQRSRSEYSLMQEATRQDFDLCKVTWCLHKKKDSTSPGYQVTRHFSI